MPTQRTMRLVVAAASVLVLSLSPASLFAEPYAQVNLVSNDFVPAVNFGNGEIDAYSTIGTWEGVLDGANGMPLVNNDLWALGFRTGGASDTNPDALYFTAGVDNQAGGLFGEIFETPEPPPFVLVGLGVLALAFLRLRPQAA
jgi:hypothetical protein